MIGPRNWTRRLFGWLWVALFLSAPLELLVPDDCDGHLGITSVSAGTSQSAVPSGHLPSSPHTCHDLHGHGGLVGAVEPVLLSAAVLDEPSRGFDPNPLIQPPQDILRPPIA
ncbi:MAG: hypothetical protein ACKVZ0_05680 [Gemmatimonadales bacterium]